MRRGDPRLPVAEQIGAEGLQPWMKRLLVRLNDRFREVDIDQHELTDYGETDLHTHQHNNMTSQQGGSASERYHFTAAQHTDLTDGGETTLHRHAAQYGEMYADNVGQAIVIAAGNTWTDITAGLTGGTNTAFTFQNSRELKCNVAGKYAAHWSLSLESTGANDDIEGGIGVNGTVAANTKNHRFVLTPNQEFGVSSHGVLALAVNDLLTLMVNNNTDADDLVMQHANLMLWKIGD